tara:strand:+ start:68062 stop:69120 length:1059 start_codon:yes stop_codon:yes gene_type:complete
MKLINLSILFTIGMFLISCSKEDSNNDSNSGVANPDTEVDTPIVEQIEVLNLIKWEIIAETPVEKFDAHIVHGNKLFSLSNQSTYEFDFESANWTLLATDTENVLPNISYSTKVNFIRNGKWNMFTERGLFVFDFELNNWSVIKEFPQSNGIFATAGFYANEDNAIYFVDNSNGNDTIYKFDLVTNELLLHGEYVNVGDRGSTYNGSLVVNNSFYHVKPANGTGTSDKISISKFNDNFTNLNSINELITENDLDGSVAINYGNYIIFGLGGVPSSDANGMITSDSTTLKFYSYDVINNVFTEMPTPFYESCWGAEIVVFNNEFYLINGRTIKNQQGEARNKIEKIEFDFITL